MQTIPANLPKVLTPGAIKSLNDVNQQDIAKKLDLVL